MTKRRGHGEGSIHQRKDGSWCAIVDLGWVNGKRKRKYLYGKTRKEVADKLKTAYHDQASGVDLASERQTVEEFLKLWLEQTVKVRNRDGTYDNYAQIVRSHITPAIGKYQLTKLTPEQVQAMLNQLTGVGLAPRTVRNVRAVLRDALNQAVKRRRIPYNVAALVEIPRAEKPVITPLTPEQAQALLEAVRGDPLEALYRVALSLGLRRGEKRNPALERCRCLPSSCGYCVNIVFGKIRYGSTMTGRSMDSCFHRASVHSWSPETYIGDSSRCWYMPTYQQHFGFMTFGIVVQHCSWHKVCRWLWCETRSVIHKSVPRQIFMVMCFPRHIVKQWLASMRCSEKT